MIWNWYLSVRSDPVKGGAVFFENWLQLLLNSFRLRRTCIFLVRSDPGEGWGLEYIFLKEGFELFLFSFR